MLPQFPETERIDVECGWTAVFESFDQRLDDLYYMVTVHIGGKPNSRFIVQVSPTIHPDLWGVEPEFTQHVREAIAKVAATGRTNTTYVGRMVPLDD